MLSPELHFEPLAFELTSVINAETHRVTELPEFQGSWPIHLGDRACKCPTRQKPWQLTHTGSAGVMALRTLDQLRVEVGARFTVWNAAAPCKAGEKVIGPISTCVPKV